MSSPSLNKIALHLGEAKLTLYPANVDGSPQLDAPLWSGADAEGLKVRERWINVGTRPTGAPKPRNHPLTPVYEIAIDRVWALPLAELTGFHPDHEEYVLDVVWVEEETLQWHRRTFYGVTITERAFDSREIDTGFTDAQQFDARSMVVDAGEWPVPALSADLPYQVLWIGNTGQTPLYSYNPATQAFTAVGTTAGRATIGYSGSAFRILFEDYPVAVETYASGLGAVALLESMPLAGDVPRLDFLYGTRRVASVTPNGLWARAFTDGATPAAGAGKFALKFGGAVVATLALEGVEATEFGTL
jgi:hypothetical protein